MPDEDRQSEDDVQEVPRGLGPEYDRERAREAGRIGGLRSAEARRKRAELRADVLARFEFEQHAGALAKVLIDAGLGRGKFDGLNPKDQATFAAKALEYGIGRPRQAEKGEPEEDEPEEGFSFGEAEAS